MMNDSTRIVPSSNPAWQAVRDAASRPYRRVGRFAWHFARGKLGMDPIFRHVLSRGLIAPGARVLDIGCGQGLLASLLHAADDAAARGDWPADWARAPRSTHVVGIELMPRDIARAKHALGDSTAATFIGGDMRTTPFPPSDVVVILDALHYIDIAEQNRVLQRVRAALGPHGRLLLRVGDASARRAFRTSQWVDAIVTFVRGHRVPPTFGRPLAAWTVKLEALGFHVQAVPMSHGTPFANVLLVAEVAEVFAAGAGGTARAIELAEEAA